MVALLIVAALAYAHSHQNGEILHSMEADAAGVNTMVQHLEAVPIDASSGTCKNEGDFCSGNHCVKVPCRAKMNPAIGSEPLHSVYLPFAPTSLQLGAAATLEFAAHESQNFGHEEHVGDWCVCLHLWTATTWEKKAQYDTSACSQAAIAACAHE